MITNIKWIGFGIVLAGLIALFIWGDKIPAGSVFAGLAGFIAIVKSKFLGIDKLQGKLKFLQKSHADKREAWEIEKLHYEEQVDTLKKRMDSLSLRIEVLYNNIRSTEESDFTATERSEEEILRWLKEN